MKIDLSKMVPADAIMAMRLAAELSQEELAAKMGTTRGWIGHLERGIRKCPTEALWSVAVACGFTLSAERTEGAT